MKKYCYVCGKVLSEHPSSDECKCHDEHIIPNAIGGHLTSRDFACDRFDIYTRTIVLGEQLARKSILASFQREYNQKS